METLMSLIELVVSHTGTYSRWAVLASAFFLLLIWRLVWNRRHGKEINNEDSKSMESPTHAPVRVLYGTTWLAKCIGSRRYLEAYRSGARNKWLQKLHRTEGSTFCTHRRDQIFTVDRENLRAVFGGHADEWGVELLRLSAFMPLIGPGTLSTDGEFWRHARMVCQTNLNWIQRFRNRDLSCYDANIRKLIDIIPGDGETTDMALLFNRYMVDSSADYILGGPVGSLQPGTAGQEGRGFLEAFIYAIEECGSRNEAWQITDIMASRRLKHNCSIVHAVIDRFVQRALHEAEALEVAPPEASLVLRWAMETKDAEEIRNQVLNVLMAAYDTTAITLTHAVFHLSRHPESYQKLRQEALLWNGQPLTADNIKSLTYLRAVINETLRLNTPATFNSRIALRDTSLPKGGGLGGQLPVRVPRGTIVSSSIYTVQRSTDVYGDDADIFRPERWEVLKPKHWDYLPFSAGPRVCPGQKIALAQTAYVLLCLLRHFARLENRDVTWELVERYKVSTSSKNGALVAWFR